MPNPPAPDHTDPATTAGAGKSGKPDKPGKDGRRTWLTGLPDSVRLLVLLWAAALVGEVIHQIINVVMSLLDPSALLATAREAAESAGTTDITDDILNGAVTSAVIIMGLTGVLIMGLLAVMLVLVQRRSRYAPMARRLLLIFGFYFGFRALLMFTASPGGSDVPLGLYLFDGSLQILIGVAAVLALIFGGRRETLKWTGELQDTDGPGRPGRMNRSNPPSRQDKSLNDGK